MTIVDLRSDAVTRPSPAMRRAMAEAEVGDDVFGEDPTARRLEEQVAALLGTEAALFVPSGTMANQIALRAQTKPGDEVIAGRDAHCWRSESGALAALAGVQAQILPEHRFTAADVRAAFKSPADPYSSPTRVVAVENTHNMGGGTCWELAQLAEVTTAAHALGMATHLDGARLWNAAVATGVPVATLCAGFDSISVCLSKGLGAPVGSLVAGSRDLITRCHRLRKMHGGGMRQIGILAAAGLYALEHHRARLAEDHAHARLIATAVAASPHARVDLERVQTNIVMMDVADAIALDRVIAGARAEGVLLWAAGAHRLRAVTHLDVDRAGAERAATVIVAQLAAAAG